MHRVDTSTSIAVLPAADAPATPGFFTKGNPGGGTAATVPGQDWFNDLQENVIEVLARAGIAPVKARKEDLADAIQGLIANAAPGAISSLVVTNNAADAAHDIDIAPGTFVMADGAGAFKLFTLSGPALVKRIDADWVAGTGNGGFPSGLALAANTFYRVFAIGKDDGTADFGFDTDDGAANLLADAAGYTWFRRIAWVLTDGSANIIAFHTSEGPGGAIEVVWDVPRSDHNITDPNPAGELVTLSAPPNVLAHFSLMIDDPSAAGGNAILVTETRQANTTPTATVSDLRTTTGERLASGEFRRRTDASRQIRYRVGITPVDQTARIKTQGWTDERRG